MYSPENRTPLNFVALMATGLLMAFAGQSAAQQATPAAAAVAAAIPAAPIKPAAAASKATATSKVTIGQITELNREVKAAELKKQLRDLTKDNSMPTVPGVPPGAKLPTAFPLSFPGAGVPAAGGNPGYTLTPTAPRVEVIYGTAGRLRARLADGREVQTGQQVAGAGGMWMAKSITPTSVQFEHCAPAAAPDNKSKSRPRAAPPADRPTTCRIFNMSPVGA